MRKRASGIMLIAALALAGCAAETALDTAAPSTPPVASPESTETADAAALPAACEDFLPAATIGETLDETWNDSGETRDPAEELPGPTARAAAAAATETLRCLWHPELATEGYVLGFAMQIERASRTELVTAFGASDAYEPILIEGADISFSTSEVRGDLRHTTMYAFVGDIWIAIEAPLFTEDLVTLIGTAVSNVTAT